MKKPVLMFTLLLGLTLSSMAPLQAMEPTDQPKQTSPRLLSILKKKYIDKQPLDKNEQIYFDNASVAAFATAMGLLGLVIVGGAGGAMAAAIKADTDANRKKTLNAMDRFGVNLNNPNRLVDFMYQVENYRNDFEYVLTQFPEYQEMYYDLSKQDGFKRALSNMTGKPVGSLPTLEKHGEGAYYF